VTAPLRATYRLQLTASFGFDHARAVVPYLSSLGV
jgi:(1->4)-alpha-D-glucan 1-alpha-D-glucosylmutase